MKKKFIISSICAVSVIAVAVIGIRYAYYQGYIRTNYPSYEQFPIHGIDVSHHQSHIDWMQLDKQVVQFAFIKATEGVNHKDSLFAINWQSAKEQHVHVGAYHYFSFCRGGEEQADNFIESVPRDSTDMPPVVDLEFGGNCREANRKQNLIEEISLYINKIERHYKKRVIIYSTNEFYKTYLIGKFPDNPIWIRNILSEPQLPDNRKWTFWQFTNRGKLDGINSAVDLNVFAGNKSQFERFVNDTILHSANIPG